MDISTPSVSLNYGNNEHQTRTIDEKVYFSIVGGLFSLLGAYCNENCFILCSKLLYKVIAMKYPYCFSF